MVKYLRTLALSLVTVLTALTLPAQAGDWRESYYDKDNDVRVFTRRVEGSDMNAFRGVTFVNSTLTAPIALLQDVDRAHEWVFNCKAMALIEELSPTNALYYTVTSMPWPVMNRDSISETHILQDPQTGAVTVTMDARNDVFPENDDHVRVRQFSGTWTIEPQSEGVVKVTYEAHADPGGGIPSWLVNSFVVDAPLNTLRRFRRLVVEEQYQTATRDFITH